MLDIAQIVTSLTTNRAEFGYLFLQAQIKFLSSNRNHFEAVSAGIANDNVAFTKALTFAQLNGFLEEFMQLAVDSSLENGTIATFVMENLTTGSNAKLQAMTNPAAGFTLPGVKRNGIFSSAKWTGKIIINGVFKGSGVLIHPNLFLTAWHVVQDLFNVSPAPTGSMESTPKTFAAPQKCPLVVQFDDLLYYSSGSLASTPSKIVSAHQDWYVYHSTCHAVELTNNIPNPTSSLSGFWDYAVIRLSAPCGFERRWASLERNAVVPPNGADITLFQHPAGADLKMDDRTVCGSELPDPAIPMIRFLHQANSLPGSSGGPCFDKGFSLIGIHQGRWPPTATGKVNRGIPIINIIDHLFAQINTLPMPAPNECPVWRTNKQQLVIGCDLFILCIWDMAITGNYRMLSIKGEAKTGKTFLTDVACTVLPDIDHLKIVLRAEDMSKLGPMDLAKRICSIAGADIPIFATCEEYNSSVSAWLRDELLARMVATIDSKRNGRKVWIFITDLNVFTIEDSGSSDLLFLIYELLVPRDWLRVVLDGANITVPVTVKDICTYYATTSVINTDIVNCLNRLFSEVNNVDGQSTAPMLADFLFGEYTNKRNIEPASAMPALAQQTRDLVSSFLNRN